MDKLKEFSPVDDMKKLIGFILLVIVAVYIAKKLPLPASFKP
jgi:hypothetical protein